MGPLAECQVLLTMMTMKLRDSQRYSLLLLLLQLFQRSALLAVAQLTPSKPSPASLQIAIGLTGPRGQRKAVETGLAAPRSKGRQEQHRPSARVVVVVAGAVVVAAAGVGGSAVEEGVVVEESRFAHALLMPRMMLELVMQRVPLRECRRLATLLKKSRSSEQQALTKRMKKQRKADQLAWDSRIMMMRKRKRKRKRKKKKWMRTRMKKKSLQAKDEQVPASR